MHTYEVGMGSDIVTIKAPTAGVAAMFYSIHLINTNNPFMAIVYKQDDQPYEGGHWWVNVFADENHVKMVVDRLLQEAGEDFYATCEVIESEDTTS
jgi:hypothetical protein